MFLMLAICAACIFINPRLAPNVPAFIADSIVFNLFLSASITAPLVQDYVYKEDLGKAGAVVIMGY